MWVVLCLIGLGVSQQQQTWAVTRRGLNCSQFTTFYGIVETACMPSPCTCTNGACISTTCETYLATEHPPFPDGWLGFVTFANQDQKPCIVTYSMNAALAGCHNYAPASSTSAKCTYPSLQYDQYVFRRDCRGFSTLEWTIQGPQCPAMLTGYNSKNNCGPPLTTTLGGGGGGSTTKPSQATLNHNVLFLLVAAVLGAIFF